MVELEKSYSSYIQGLQNKISECFSTIEKLECEREEINGSYSHNMSDSVKKIVTARRSVLTNRIAMQIEKNWSQIQKLQEEVDGYNAQLEEHLKYQNNMEKNATFCCICNTAKSTKVRILNIDENTASLGTEYSQQISVNRKLFVTLFDAISYGIYYLTSKTLTKEKYNELLEHYERE